MQGANVIYRDQLHKVVEVVENSPPTLGHVKDRGWFARPDKVAPAQGPFYHLRCAHKPACRDIEYEKQNLLPGDRGDVARWGPTTAICTWIHEDLLKLT